MPTPEVPLPKTVRLLTTTGEPGGRQAAKVPPPAIPGYEILGELGRGGMGVVFKARHLKLNRVVALKMILHGELASEQEIKRFLAEAEAIAQIQHPAIIQIFEIGEHEGRLFLSLEYCGGGSLEDLLRGTPLPADDAVRLLLTLAGAVEHAHRCGVIHRDLKPANVLLQDQAPHTAKPPDAEPVEPGFGPGSTLVPKITDFGLAKTVNEAGDYSTSRIIGTPWYMSPEQAVGKEVGPLSDVYSLGATFYECLSGRPPFRAATLMETLNQVQKEEPVPPRQLQRSIPRDVETICLKCLQKEPARRYATAGELRDDLQRFLDGKPIRARPVGWAGHTWRWCRRNPVVAGLLALVAALLLSGMVASAVALVVIDDARQKAEDHAANEAAAKTNAERSAEESRERLVRLHVATGTRFLDANDRASALSWYAHAWRSDRPDPKAEKNHRLRLAFVLGAGPQLVGVCFHPWPVQDAAVSPDGSRLLSYLVAGRDAYLWDPAASRLAAPPLHHEGDVRHACYSPDGRLVGTAAADGTACVWDAGDGKRLHKLDHPAGVAWLAFRPGTTQLVTVDDRGALRGWDTTTGRPAGTWPRSEAGFWYAAFSEDGRLLVTADRGDRARVWDASTGEAKSPPLPHLALRPDEAYFHYKRWPVFNAQATLLLTATQRAVQLWDVATGEARWPGGRVVKEIQAPMHVAFNRQGDRVVVSDGYVARVLRVEDGQEVLGLTHPRQNQSAAFSDDGRYLVSTSSGGLIHVWDVASGRAVDQPERCVDFVRRVGFFPDNRRFFAASLDGTVRVWSLAADGSPLKPYAFDCGRAHNVVFESPSGSRTFSPDAVLVAEFGPAGVTVRRREGDEKPLFHLPGATRWARFTSDGRRLLTANLKEVHSFDALTGRPLGKPFPLDGSRDRRDFAVRTARIFPSADGRRVATLDDPRTLSVWDAETARRVFGPWRASDGLPHVFGPPERRGQITQPRLSADGRTLFFGVPSGGILAAWDLVSGEALYQVKKYSGNLHDIAVSEDGRCLLAVSSNTTARLYDARTGAPLGPPLAHTGTVLNGDVASDGVRVVTREGSTARVWDARKGDLLVRLPALPKDVEPLWFSRDGTRVVLGGHARAFQWQLPGLEIPAGVVPALVRLLTGRDIDDANGITQLDQNTFVNDRAAHRRAWVMWRGGTDDPSAQP
jgi:WD40 repeat protein/tRNA A-37 threonylcarbamoyl transferase component Bud32